MDDYIELPENVINHDDITITSWGYWEGGNAWQRIFDFGVQNTAGNPQSYFFITPSNSQDMMTVAISTGSYTQEEILVTSALATNQWRHVAITIVNNTATLYIDGIV
ncbi:MAG: LamG domain-containing protein [Colwellia sp.]